MVPIAMVVQIQNLETAVAQLQAQMATLEAKIEAMTEVIAESRLENKTDAYVDTDPAAQLLRQSLSTFHRKPGRPRKDA